MHASMKFSSLYAGIAIVTVVCCEAISAMLPRLSRDMNTGGEHECAAEHCDRGERFRPLQSADAHRDEWLREREDGGARGADPAEPDEEQHAGARADQDTPGDQVGEVGR